MKSTLAVTFSVVAAARVFAETLTFESAEGQATLVELFTSEGCSSCPPADAWISKLKSSPDLWKRVVPVAFHVDYWNNLGWADRFALRAHSERQHRYATEWRSASVYTPGLVLNGREWRGWSNRESLPAASAAKPGVLQVKLRDSAHADVDFTPAGARLNALRVEIALLGGDLQSDVERGENSGRKLRHDFIVLHWQSAALSPSQGRHTASITLPGNLSERPTALAAWVTSGDSQTPIQAAGSWLKVPLEVIRGR